MTRRDTTALEFGTELRRLRIAAGLSMSELAERIQFSKGYISKVETGQKVPSLHFVRKADAVLPSDGLLITLAEDGGKAAAVASSRVGQIERREETTPPSREGLVAADSDEAAYSLAAFKAILDQLRDLGQTLDPSVVVEMLKPHVPALRDLAGRLDRALADKALRLAAHFADFTSWMTQEAGDDMAALRWIDLAEAFADEASDSDLVANSYVRRANIALYQQDAYGTITFARQAQAIECRPRVKSLAAQREAQGHALAGDYRSFSACLDRAVALKTNASGEQADGPVIGPMRIVDPVALARGWSLFDLGRSAEAIEVLEPLLAQAPKERSRAWARIACRLALSLASMREVERSCALTVDILTLAPVIRSATIRSDLRQLSRMLTRWSFDPSVRDIMPRLSAALLPTAGHTSLFPSDGGEAGR